MNGTLIKSLSIALLVSVVTLLISIPLGSVFTPYAAISFSFVPEHLSNTDFMVLMGKAFGWIFFASLLSSLVTLYVCRTKAN